MQKILLTSNLCKSNIGGIENSLYYMAREYVAQRVEVHVVANDLNNFTNEPLSEYEMDAGFMVYKYQAGTFFKRLVNGVSLYKKFNGQYHYSKVICQSHIALLLMRITGIKNILYIPAGVNLTQNKKLEKKIRKKVAYYVHSVLQIVAARQAKKVFVFSKMMKKQFERNLFYKKEIGIVRPGVSFDNLNFPSTAFYNALRDKNGYSNKDVVVVAIGRFFPIKGFEILIESMSLLPDEYHLLLVGDGDDKERYLDLVQLYKLKDRVRIVGPVSNTSSYYQMGDLYVSSSLHETLGQTVLEALCCGLPIVAFSNKTPGVLTAIDEITDRSNAVLSSDLSAKGLAEAVIIASEKVNKGEFVKEKVSTDAKNKYSWSAMLSEL